MSKRRSDYLRYLNSGAWRAKRLEAFAAHGKRCSKCGRTSRLQVHHKRYAKDLNAVPVKHLEILCEPCHQRHHKEAKAERRRNRQARKAPASKDYLVELLLSVDSDECNLALAGL